MSSNPARPSPYEVLGVSPSATQAEIRTAYLRLARVAHPDLGGTAERFAEVQLAWEAIGEAKARETYDVENKPDWHPQREDARSPHSGTARPRATSGARGGATHARMYGYPGGLAREHFLSGLQQWVGRGITIDDPFDAALVRSAPLPLRLTLSKALAEEATARTLRDFGLGFTVWNSATVAGSTASIPIIDHVVLGPTGLYVVGSFDWAGNVVVERGDLESRHLPAHDRPLHGLRAAAKALSKAAGVAVTGVMAIVPDEDLADPTVAIERGKTKGVLVVRRSVFAHILHLGTSTTGIGEVFEVRTRLQKVIRLVE